FSPIIVADGRGGAIVAWLDLRSLVTAPDVFAQHVLANGVVDSAWPANGRALAVVPGSKTSLVMASDDASGAIVAWIDARAGSNQLDVYAQRVTSVGSVDPRWPVNGLALTSLPG